MTSPAPSAQAPQLRHLRHLRHLRWISAIEGVSLLVLVGVAMPLKYAAGMPMAVRIVGMAHGVLFLAFVAALWRAASAAGWPWARAARLLALSVVPFGMVWIDRDVRGA